MKRFNFFCIIACIGILLLPITISAELLDSWEDERAYKPLPILLLHGFASGSPTSWSTLAPALYYLYYPYQDIGPVLSNSDSYVERIDFQDPNGSIDRYDPGKFNPQGNSAGWADKVAIAVDNMLSSDYYGSYCDKVILIAHSMGGLVAREYITTSGLQNVAKLITINTPHAGSPLANVALNINKSRITARKIPYYGWAYSVWVSELDGYLNWQRDIDINGEAAKDTAIGSEFLSELNNRVQPSGEELPTFAFSSYINSDLNRFFFHPYYPNPRTSLEPADSGDTIVPIDSQEGFDVFTNPGEVREVWHFSEIKRFQGDHSAALWDPIVEYPDNDEDEPVSVSQKIIKWIDSEQPEVEITNVKIKIPIEDTDDEIEIDAPFINGAYFVKGGVCTLEGTVSKAFFPADTYVYISYLYGDNETEHVLLEGGEGAKILKPIDSWDRNDSDSVVAGFEKEIRLSSGAGTYTVKVKVTNPAGVSSEFATVKIVVYSNNSFTDAGGFGSRVEIQGGREYRSYDEDADEDEDNDGLASASFNGSYYQFSTLANSNSLTNSVNTRVSSYTHNYRCEAETSSGFCKYYYVISNNGIDSDDIGREIAIRINSSVRGELRADYYYPPDWEDYSIIPLCYSSLDVYLVVNKDGGSESVLASLFNDFYDDRLSVESEPSEDTYLNINHTESAEFNVPVGDIFYVWQSLGSDSEVYYGLGGLMYGIFAESNATLATQITVLDTGVTLMELEELD